LTRATACFERAGSGKSRVCGLFFWKIRILSRALGFGITGLRLNVNGNQSATPSPPGWIRPQSSMTIDRLRARDHQKSATARSLRISNSQFIANFEPRVSTLLDWTKFLWDSETFDRN
jgi:hypothetical protein